MAGVLYHWGFAAAQSRVLWFCAGGLHHGDYCAARYGSTDAGAGGDAVVVAAPLLDDATGGRVHRCPGCGYEYDEVTGDEREGFAAGTPWSDVPATWCCPDCGVRDKLDFVVVPVVGS